MFDRCGNYDGKVGYCEGHAVFDEGGDDDGNATAGDDITCVYEGHDGRHDWHNKRVSALSGGGEEKKRTRCGENKEKTPAETGFLNASNKSKREQNEDQICQDVRCVEWALG